MHHSKSDKFITIDLLKLNLSIGLLCATVNTRTLSTEIMADDDDIITHSGFCCVQKISLRTRYGLCTVYILIRRMIVAGVRADSVQLMCSLSIVSNKR